MKKIILLLLIFLISVAQSFGQVTIEKYIFPIHPGEQIWKTTRYPERVKMLRIPDSTLKKLNNVQLIGACYEYPFWINLFAFNSLDEGYRNITSIFNGYGELENRKDIGSDLIDFYSNMNAFDFTGKYSVFNETANAIKFYLIEYLLQRDKIMDNLTPYLQRQLYFIVKNKYDLKKNGKVISEGNPVFSDFSLISTIKVMCKLALKQTKYLNDNIVITCQNIIADKNLSSTNFDIIIKFLDSIYK
jgi:hypothetical protein